MRLAWSTCLWLSVVRPKGMLKTDVCKKHTFVHGVWAGRLSVVKPRSDLCIHCQRMKGLVVVPWHSVKMNQHVTPLSMPLFHGKFRVVVAAQLRREQVNATYNAMMPQREAYICAPEVHTQGFLELNELWSSRECSWQTRVLQLWGTGGW